MSDSVQKTHESAGDGSDEMLGEEAFKALAADFDEARVDRWTATAAARDVAAIVYTLGTGPIPNGTVLTHEALVRGWAAVGERWQMSPEDRLWSPCPMFHLSGLGPLISALAHGATYVGDGYFDPSRALQVIADERVTMLYPIYPPIVQALLESPEFSDADLSATKLWLVVAPAQTWRQLAGQLPQACLISTYGTIESGPITMHEPADDLEVRLSTFGRPLPGVEIRIVDRETGLDLPAGKTGEIVHRGYTSFSGYHNEPERTATATDLDGWVRPGDVGMLDEDRRLVFYGRLGGANGADEEKVVPAEIEDFDASGRRRRGLGAGLGLSDLDRRHAVADRHRRRRALRRGMRTPSRAVRPALQAFGVAARARGARGKLLSGRCGSARSRLNGEAKR
ncbi:fatty acid--CoA ligase family protein [Aromatoleum toluclasticum]|uniref:class I adenylate-forming enzyme family protein n=1 Tax=Aromatoleum toluclasticum TaxID=92003 RepID=UPI001D188428|nr:fatty acid--CoA ligase family protein [Aromatoleum toluclasticum]MCC4114733.1 fatty acid--CoA ligase family protein [Aromatoleum toluclasticum]